MIDQDIQFSKHNQTILADSDRVIRAEDVAFRVVEPFEISKDTSTNSILNSICTSPPYFALKNLQCISNRRVKALIPVEYLNAHDAGIISAGEAARHLAILGTCAASLLDESQEKKYYLSTRAEFNFLDNSALYNTPRHQLEGVASATSNYDGTITAKANLYGANYSRLITLSVQYKVFKKKIFERIFKNHRMDICKRDTHANPYSFPIKIHSIEINNQSLTAIYGPIQPEDCLGHFDYFPALPVAIVIENFGAAICKLLEHALGTKNFKYVVRFTQVEAFVLAFSGETIQIQVNCLEIFINNHTFLCTALNAKSQVICRLLIELDVLS